MLPTGLPNTIAYNTVSHTPTNFCPDTIAHTVADSAPDHSCAHSHTDSTSVCVHKRWDLVGVLDELQFSAAAGCNDTRSSLHGICDDWRHPSAR